MIEIVNRKKSVNGLLACMMAVLLIAPTSWAGSREAILFQPGQSSWEWLLVPASHDGGKRMREGKSCLFCHDGEEKTIGNLIASGEKIEPAPLPGLPGFVEMKIDASYDEQDLYLKMSWTSPALTEALGHEDASTHLTVMLGSPELSISAIAGCWAACHSDLPGMPDTQTGQELSKYLPGSRNKMTRSGGGEDFRSEADLVAQISEGKYLEYWQAVLDQGKLDSVSDGYFLQQRVRNDDSVVTATASSDGLNWTVEMVRPLNAPGNTRHALSEGVEYTLAIALHEHHSSGRYHFTSFPMRFFVGAGEAELNADRK